MTPLQAGAGQRAGVGGNSAAPVVPNGENPMPGTDKFAHTQVRSVPPQMTMAEIRQLVASQRPASDRPKIDINNMRFGVEIEMEGFDPNQAKGPIENMAAWDTHPQFRTWKVEADASLAKGKSGEAVSPVMTLGGGKAADQIRQVVGTFTALGGESTVNCGLHIHVDASTLGEKGLANLMKMALENENGIYRYSQNGHEQHRGIRKIRHNRPYHYCLPLTQKLTDTFPMVHAGTKDEFRNALYGAVPDMDPTLNPPEHPRPALPPPGSNQPFMPARHDPVRYFGINFNSLWYRGTVEFRIFDGVSDPQQIMDNIEFCLGMVKAASEDNYDFVKSNPMARKSSSGAVSREAFNYFLDQVATTPELKARFLKTFEQGGGQIIEDQPVTDPAILNTAFLMEEGYRFEADGKQMTSPFEVIEEIGAHRRAVTATAPGGGDKPNKLGDASDVETLVMEVEASMTFAPGDVQRLQNAMQQLQSKGFTFCYAPAEINSESLAQASRMQLTRDRQLMGALNRQRLMIVPPQATQESVQVKNLDELHNYATLECADRSQLRPEAQDVLRMVEELKEKGVALHGSQNGSRVAPLVSRYAILNTVREGNAFVPVSNVPGDLHPVRNLGDLEQVYAVVTGKRSTDVTHKPLTLDADTESAVQTLGGLEEKGVKWTFSDEALKQQKAGDPVLNRQGQLDRLREGKLEAKLPKRVIWGLGLRKEVDVTDGEKLKKLGKKFKVDAGGQNQAAKA
jgi:hypothetical protein